MTPKEKARDLVYKFYPSVQWKLGQEDCLDRAKRCALIAVDEIINFNTFLHSIELADVYYWLDIKKEIEKL